MRAYWFDIKNFGDSLNPYLIEKISGHKVIHYPGMSQAPNGIGGQAWVYYPLGSISQKELKGMYIQIPVKTEVIAKNEDICTQGRFEDGKIVIAMDARKRDYKKLWDKRADV